MTTLRDPDHKIKLRLERQRVANLPRRYLLWLWVERKVFGVCTLHGDAQNAKWCRATKHPSPWQTTGL